MRAKGIDISHWNEDFAYHGEDFIIQKATEGWSWVDPKFDEYQPEVMKAPITGAYHYFLTELDPKQQAEHFWETVRGAGYDFLVVDYEGYNNNLNEAGAANLRVFWDKLHELTDDKILLYTSPYIYRDNLYRWSDFWKSVPLWMAHYNGQDPETGSPQIFGGSGWLLWQYTSEGGDQNVYNGTFDEMKAWLEKGEEPMKKPWNSKTIIFFVLTLLVSVAGLFGFAEFEMTPEMAQIAGVIVSIVGIILRAVTKEGIEL